MCLEINTKNILGLLFHSVVKLFLSPNLLCLPHERPVDLREEVLRQGKRLYLESQVTEKMAGYCLKINYLIRVWMSGSLIDQKWGGGEEAK